MSDDSSSVMAPVHFIPGDENSPPPRGAGLCLSGGGYRAMLFHVGVLRRLYETGDLAQLERISSVSGGSITAGVLALAWDHLYPSAGSPDPDAYTRLVQAPVLKMASTSIDVSSIALGLVEPWASHRRQDQTLSGHALRRPHPGRPAQPADIRHQRH